MQELINKVHNMDCLEFMKKLPDKCVDLVFTSPPYNLGHVKKGGFYRGKNKGLNISYDIHKDTMSPENYIRWQHLIIIGLKRIIKTTGAIFYNHKPRILDGVYDDRKNLLPCAIRPPFFAGEVEHPYRYL